MRTRIEPKQTKTIPQEPGRCYWQTQSEFRLVRSFEVKAMPLYVDVQLCELLGGRLVHAGRQDGLVQSCLVNRPDSLSAYSVIRYKVRWGSWVALAGKVGSEQ